MRILIATDAWHPQVNGVVRTLTSLARAAEKLGVTIEFLSPEGFPSVRVPTYPGLRLALPSPRRIARRIEQARPDAIHIATEGTISSWPAPGVHPRRPFTTSYTTRFPEYISALADQGAGSTPRCAAFMGQGRDHGGDTVAGSGLSGGFKNIGVWTRGVDTDLFSPDRAIKLDLPTVFISVGRSRSGKISRGSFARSAGH
jgi:glycosyltransferase involved in cell wall biosynthesis